MSDTDLQRNLAGSWNLCDQNGFVWSIWTLKRDGTFVVKIYGERWGAQLTEALIGGLEGNWHASEYENGKRKPYIKLRYTNLDAPLFNMFGPLKHFIGLPIRLFSDSNTEYITNVQKKKILLQGGRYLARR